MRDFYEEYSVEQLKAVIQAQDYRIYKMNNPTIDEQIIHFWHLQLQFMDMDEYYLADIHSMILYNKMRFTPLHRNHEDIATELALHLSGLA